MTFEEMRALFPSAQKAIHLNHAGVSPIARPVVESTRAVTDELTSDDPFLCFKNHMTRQENLRASFGRMLGVAPGTLAFVRNTSHGLAIASQAIAFTPGDVVIVAGNEYPANIYPWQAQVQRGVRVHLVPPRENGIVAEDDLLAACAGEPRARVLAVSWVQWGTGQAMDLARLGDYCRARGLLFVVDAVQGLGALRLNLGALPVDIAASGCHKWLLAPGGQGVLYVRDGLLPDLLPTNIGWNAVADPLSWERLQFDQLKPTTDRFEEGTPGVLAVAALKASVDVLEEVGFDAINARVRELSAFTRDLLARRGCRVVTPDNDSQRSGIIAFRHPTQSNEAVLQSLAARKIVAAVRCNAVRFSPHAYSREEDLETAVAAL